jgi:hypothetical protein
MAFNIILLNLKTDQKLILDTTTSKENAEHGRKSWRNVLGGKRWTVNRYPGLDTLDHLGLTIEEVK